MANPIKASAEVRDLIQKLTAQCEKDHVALVLGAVPFCKLSSQVPPDAQITMSITGPGKVCAEMANLALPFEAAKLMFMSEDQYRKDAKSEDVNTEIHHYERKRIVKNPLDGM